MGSELTDAVSGPVIRVGQPDERGKPLRKSVVATKSTFQDELLSALKEVDIRGARSLVAREETRLRDQGSDPAGAGFAELAAAKARIAHATGDAAAAHAILVAAIETAPEVRMLRILMSEIMLSAGRASDARPVLRHLGATKPVSQEPTDAGRVGDTSTSG